MGRRILLAGALLLALAPMWASPAAADLAGDAPPPPEYRVEGDGTLVVGGDVLVPCSQVGGGDSYVGADDPGVRAQIERFISESARACEAAGFPTRVDPPVAALVPVALLVGAGLLAFGTARRDF